MVKLIHAMWHLVIGLMCVAGIASLPAHSTPDLQPGPTLQSQSDVSPQSLATCSQDYCILLPLNLTTPPAYFVSQTGNDNNLGTYNAPWRTFQKAANVAPAGSIIYARGGVYTGFELVRSGLTFAGYPGEAAVVIGDGSRTNTIDISGVSNVAIRDLTVENNFLQYGTGVYVENSSVISVTNNLFRDNQGFGLVLKDVANTLVENNDVTRNGNAVEVRYGSNTVLIRNNRVYQNNRVVDSGRAAIGITFYRTTGPVIAQGNYLWDNHTPDTVNPDGGAFEVYAASNVTMTENVIWDNDVVLETGTDQTKAACDHITFIRNIAYNTLHQMGLILRCASNSLIAQNTFDGLDLFTFDLSHNSGPHGGSIEGLRILNNISVNGRVYSIDNALPVTVTIDYNLAYNPGQKLAYAVNQGNTTDFATFQSWTGYETHGLSLDPLFVNEAARNYHLTFLSPALNRGIILADPYNGTAPDLGRYEYP